jgi:integrase
MRGTIIQRGGKGGRWSAVVDLPRDENGKRRRQWHSGYRTKKDADAALTEILSRLQKGDYVQPSKETLRAYLHEWLDSARANLKPSTWESYKMNVETHVIPRLGNVAMQALRTAQLNALYADLLREGRKRNGSGGLSARTVRYIHTIIHRALREAVAWGRLSRNVAIGAAVPKQTNRPEMRTWAAAELRAFLEHVQGDRLHSTYLTAATTGLRRGELLGLRWQDVDLESGRLAVRQTLIAVGYELSSSDPKTTKSRRLIALDPVTIGALRTHRKAQLEERLRWGAAWQDNGLVFCREDGSHLHPDRFTDWFQEHVKAAGLPRIRLHDLRHTHATLALQAGIHPKVVSERLGHSNISITLDTYSHAIPAMQEEAAAKVAKLVFG